MQLSFSSCLLAMAGAALWGKSNVNCCRLFLERLPSDHASITHSHTHTHTHKTASAAAAAATTTTHVWSTPEGEHYQGVFSGNSGTFCFLCVSVHQPPHSPPSSLLPPTLLVKSDLCDASVESMSGYFNITGAKDAACKSHILG